MPNPLQDQGIINRLRATVIIPGAPDLTVTPPFLAKPGIRLALEGATTTAIPTMTGVTQSPEPYNSVNIQIPMLRSQSLANRYKLRMELNVLLGKITVRTDSTSLGDFNFFNCSIMSVGEIDMGGSDATFGVTLSGIYYLNASLWEGV